MKLFGFICITVALAWTISGCVRKYESIKNKSPYNTLVGQVYYSKVITYLQGITRDSGYKPEVDYYSLVLPPGISGPEIISEVKLSPGVQLTIDDVKKCINCFFGTPMPLIVRIKSDEILHHDPISLYAPIVNIKTLSGAGERVVLDPEFFTQAD